VTIMRNWPPTSITTDKFPSSPEAIERLQRDGQLAKDTRRRTSKYLNNIIEADHGALKRVIQPTLGFRLGITQESAWLMLHRIRLAMQNGSLLKIGGNGGEVEADETFIGGKARNMHTRVRHRRIAGTGTKDKVAVMGILKRGGEVRTAVVPSRRKACPPI